MKYQTLVAVLGEVSGCTFVGIDATTVVELRGGKKNEMLGRVTKSVRGVKAFAFGNNGTNGYENMVNRHRIAEGKPGNFKVGELPWGKRIPDSPLIVHEKNGEVKFYLQLVIDPRAHPIVEYFLDGTPIAKEDIKGLPVPVASTAKQGLEEEDAVIVRTFGADSIDAIRAYGEEVR